MPEPQPDVAREIAEAVSEEFYGIGELDPGLSLLEIVEQVARAKLEERGTEAFGLVNKHGRLLSVRLFAEAIQYVKNIGDYDDTVRRVVVLPLREEGEE